MTPLTEAAIEEAFKSDESLQKSALEVAKDLTAGSYQITDFVEKLGFALTSPAVETRVNGTKLLSGVLAALPQDFLSEAQLVYLTTFYADRMKDHHNVMPAVIDGFAALIQMKHLPAPSVSQLLHSFFQNTTCQSQTRGDREKLYEIFKTLAMNYTEELKAMSGDFLSGLVSSIDGERDPRNLDFIFTFMPHFIAAFPLLHLAEELFEIFACYFPVDFNPSSQDPATITREKLAAKLAKCLVATPEFASWAVALAIEKLDSDLEVAKLDSLDLLLQASLRFPPKVLEPHFQEIWTALKAQVFPGADNSEVIGAALQTLRTLLEQAAAEPEISKNYQTSILATILTHLSDVNQRLFKPATAIGLVCIAGDAKYAGDKILNTFLLKLKETEVGSAAQTEQSLQIFPILAQIFKIVSVRQTLKDLDVETCSWLHERIIAALRQATTAANLDVLHASLSVLNESVPLINEANRALLYAALVQLITHETLDLEFTLLLEQLGALHPIEVQSNCIDVCTRSFALFSVGVKRKVYKNLLPLVKQMAFTQRILDLVMTNVFREGGETALQLLALEALNELLAQEEPRFIEDLQHNQSLIAKLIELAQRSGGSGRDEELQILEQIASALSLIVQQLALAEQYTIATEYLPQLNLQLAADLFVAKGLLGFLHKDISLDDHFERLLRDLTELSLTEENPQLRQVAQHLLCSLLNKTDLSGGNRGVLAAIIAKLKGDVKRQHARAVETLAWMAKGLTMRGFDDAGEIIEALAELLDHPSLANVAILAFDIVSAECPQLHLPAVKFLYKQKFFHTVLRKLGNKLEAFCEHHLKAFVYVLKATPRQVLKMNIEKIGPILFKGLESTDTHTLCTALDICEGFVQQKDEYFRAHLVHLVPSCLRLSRYEEAMEVRVSSLKLLYDITKYPTFVLMPLKVDVVLELSKALDDRKRLVRNAAVKARNSWFLLGAPGNEAE